MRKDHYSELFAALDPETAQEVRQRIGKGDAAFLPSQVKFKKGRIRFPGDVGWVPVNNFEPANIPLHHIKVLLLNRITGVWNMEVRFKSEWSPGMAWPPKTAMNQSPQFIGRVFQTEREMLSAVFPILVSIDKNHSRLVGTGFFLTRYGHFVTAKHLIEEVYDFEAKKQRVGVGIHAWHFPQGAQLLNRNITRFCMTDHNDIAVGQMEFRVFSDTGLPVQNKTPRFTLQRPQKRISTFTFPESSQYWQPVEEKISRLRPMTYKGRVRRFHESGQGFIKWPHFEVEMDIMGGASGGPAFDPRGRVFGINCTGGTHELTGIGRITYIEPILDLTVYDFLHPALGVGDYLVSDLASIGEVIFDPPL
jgi:hypothetical protein